MHIIKPFLRTLCRISIVPIPKRNGFRIIHPRLDRQVRAASGSQFDGRKNAATHERCAVLRPAKIPQSYCFPFFPGIPRACAVLHRGSSLRYARARCSQKIAAADSNVACICGRQFPVAAVSNEGHLDHVSHAPAKGFIRHTEIPRIFSPDRSQSCFHGVRSGYAGEPHLVSLVEALQGAAVFARPVVACPETSTGKTGNDASGPYRFLDEPLQTLVTRKTASTFAGRLFQDGFVPRARGAGRRLNIPASARGTACPQRTMRL